ncbi:MAG: MBL fold metallo-hydrolase, partial [Vicinamibacterales bacterium]
MATKCVINVDLADVWSERGRKKLIRTLTWGDEVTLTKEAPTHIEIELLEFQEQSDGSIVSTKVTGFIEPSKSSAIKASQVVRPRNKNDVLEVNFVDVQQGDGAVIESPDGKVILVDGGDNQLFARYLAARFRATTADKPQEIACIVVTHGDADHFAGLPSILDSETHTQKRKRL